MRYLLLTLCLFVYSCDYVHNYNANKVVQEFLDCMAKGGYGYPCKDHFLSKPHLSWDKFLKEKPEYLDKTEESCQSEYGKSCLEMGWYLYTRVYLDEEYFDVEKVGNEPFYIDKNLYFDLFSKTEFYEFEIIDIQADGYEIEAFLHSSNKYGVKNKMTLTMRNGKKGWKVIDFY